MTDAPCRLKDRELLDFRTRRVSVPRLTALRLDIEPSGYWYERIRLDASELLVLQNSIRHLDDDEDDADGPEAHVLGVRLLVKERVQEHVGRRSDDYRPDDREKDGLAKRLC